MTLGARDVLKRITRACADKNKIRNTNLTSRVSKADNGRLGSPWISCRKAICVVLDIESHEYKTYYLATRADTHQTPRGKFMIVETPINIISCKRGGYNLTINGRKSRQQIDITHLNIKLLQRAALQE